MVKNSNYLCINHSLFFPFVVFLLDKTAGLKSSLSSIEEFIETFATYGRMKSRHFFLQRSAQFGENSLFDVIGELFRALHCVLLRHQSEDFTFKLRAQTLDKVLYETLLSRFVCFCNRYATFIYLFADY